MAGKPQPNSEAAQAARLTDKLGFEVSRKMLKCWIAKGYDLTNIASLKRSIKNQERQPKAMKQAKKLAAKKQKEEEPKPPEPPPLNPDDVETFSNEVIAVVESSDEALMKALYPTKTSSACQSARSTGWGIYCLLCVAVHEQTILLLSIASLNFKPCGSKVNCLVFFLMFQICFHFDGNHKL